MFKGIKFLLKYCWEFNKKYIIYLFLFQITNATIPILNIILPKYIIDELVGQKRTKIIMIYLAIFLLGTFIATLLGNIFSIKAATYKMDIFNKFQIFLSKKLTRIDFSYLEQPEFLTLIQKSDKFLYADGKGFAYVLDRAFDILGKIFIFVGIVSILMTLNILLVIFFILLVLITSMIESRYKKENIKISMEQTHYERYNYYYMELLNDFSYGKELRLGNMGDYIINKYRDKLGVIYNFYQKIFANNLKIMDSNAAINLFQQLVAYIYIIYKVLKGAIGVGSFTMYISAVTSFSSAMKEVMSSIIDIRRFEDYYGAVEEYLNTPENMYLGKKLNIEKKEEHTIEFKNVSFKYSGQEKYILEDISIVIKPGEKITIVGENGAGKTTFVKLLTRLYDPTKGEILLDGINIKDIDYETYLSIFSIVFQDYRLFSFSVKENIALSKSNDVDDNKIQDLLEKCGVGEKIKSLPNGINTEIHKNFNENGFEPSGGEGQKMALARALCKDGELIILDEPTSSLDPRSEYDLIKRFNELVGNKTVIYISHRLSSARFSDKIVVFDKGRIIEYGKHTDLMKYNGKYAELFKMQAQYYVDIE